MLVLLLFVSCLAADLDQALNSTGYEFAIRAEFGSSYWPLEAEVMQQDLSLPVDQQGLALDVNSEEKHAVGADTESPELTQALKGQCRSC